LILIWPSRLWMPKKCHSQRLMYMTLRSLRARSVNRFCCDATLQSAGHIQKLIVAWRGCIPAARQTRPGRGVRHRQATRVGALTP